MVFGSGTLTEELLLPLQSPPNPICLKGIYSSHLQEESTSLQLMVSGIEMKIKSSGIRYLISFSLPMSIFTAFPRTLFTEILRAR